jgi:hypothetical protein
MLSITSQQQAPSAPLGARLPVPPWCAPDEYIAPKHFKQGFGTGSMARERLPCARRLASSHTHAGVPPKPSNTNLRHRSTVSLPCDYSNPLLPRSSSGGARSPLVHLQLLPQMAQVGRLHGDLQWQAREEGWSEEAVNGRRGSGVRGEGGGGRGEHR